MIAWIQNLKPKTTSKINPEDLHKQAEESQRLVRDQQPHVNALSSYLEWRNQKNGFGEDFEYTLRPKEA